MARDPASLEAGLFISADGALVPGTISLAAGVGTVEFVPDETRVSPPASAMFALQMLAGTPAGDAYPFSDLEAMLRGAGFAQNELRDVPSSVQRVVLSRR